MTRAEAIAGLSEAEIPVGPVNTLAEILEDPQIHAREMVLELTHPEYGPIKQLGIPIKMSETPGAVGGAPPLFGEHNEQLLSMLGYAPDVIEECRRLGVVVRG
jgi:crotonobetainyl-CoA:carnitine CoA-transferase CaiB-like acyl-CoA transferase